MLKRTKCTVCQKEELNHVITANNVPVYMGISDSPDEEYLFEDMIFCQCRNCNTLQLQNLINPEILYQKNHNTEIIGDLWNNHYDEFISFMKKSGYFGKVLEIGDPSGKIVSRLKDNEYDHWTLIDPNPIDGVDLNSKVSIITDWIDNVELNGDYDTIVMSHIFEHLYDPVKTMKHIVKNMKKGTKVFVSIPNFNYLFNNYELPPAGLHFEHNIFLDTNIIDNIMNQARLIGTDIFYFGNHSKFFKYTYTDIQSKIRLNCYSAPLNIHKIFTKYLNIIDKINSLEDSEFIIYGAHFPAQFLFALGLDKEKFSYVMDGSPSKQNKYLYGYGLRVIAPKDILNMEKSPKILCKMGVYTNEIKESLLKIRGDIKFLCE